MSIPVCTYRAGRKSDESIVTPGSPGRSALMASSTALVTSRVLAPGSFSTTSIIIGPTDSPISGWLSWTTVATSPILVPVASSSGTCARSAGREIGRMCSMPSRWLEVSKKPPVPGVEASRKLS